MCHFWLKTCKTLKVLLGCKTLVPVPLTPLGKRLKASTE